MKNQRRSSLLVVASALALFALAACGQTPARTSTPPKTAVFEGKTPEQSESPTAEVEATPTPEPAFLTFETEQGSRASELIPLEGGSLEVTDSTGRTYRLEIPTGALLSPEEIAMTPITGVEGLPPGGVMAAAVLLEPEGLTLLEPATLTISGPNVDSEQETFAFATFAGGEDPHFAPSQDDNGSIQIPLIHFSSPGLVQVANSNVWNIEEGFAPSRQESQAVTAFLKAEQDLSGQELLDAHVAALEQWSLAVETRLRNAAAADRFIDRALADYLHWLSWISIRDQTMFDGALKDELEDRIQEMHELAAEALANAMERAHDRCVQAREVNQALRITRWTLIANKLGLWGYGGLEEASAKNLVEKCVRFRALFRSTHENAQPRGFTNAEVFADFFIELEFEDIDPSSAEVSGEGDLRYQYFTVSTGGTTHNVDTQKGTIQYKLRFNLNLIDNPLISTYRVYLDYTFPVIPKEALPYDSVAPPSAEYWAALHAEQYREPLVQPDVRVATMRQLELIRVITSADADATDGEFVDVEYTKGQSTDYAGQDTSMIALIHEPLR